MERGRGSGENNDLRYRFLDFRRFLGTAGRLNQEKNGDENRKKAKRHKKVCERNIAFAEL